jgi:hypothetical protein
MMSARFFVASMLFVVILSVVSHAAEKPGKCECSADDMQKAKVENKDLRGQITTCRDQGKVTKAELDRTKKEAQTSAEAHENELARIKDKMNVLKTNLDKAETIANKLRDQLKVGDQNAKSHDETVTKLRNEIESLQSNISKSSASLKKAEETLARSDIQAVMKVTQLSMDGYAFVEEHASAAFNDSKVALEVASEHYENFSEKATEEATRIYKKAAPAIAESQKQFMEAAEPHVETVRQNFNFGLNFLTEKIQAILKEVAKSVPAIAPHTDIAAKISAHVILLAIPAAITLFVVFGIVRRMSLVLLKLEYTVLFTLLGVVFAFASIAFVTKLDPIAKLRTAAPDTYATSHQALGGLGALLSFIQFSVLFSKADTGGKGTLELAMTLVSAGMSVLLFLHYYNLVYKKATKDASFTMPFEIKGDGGASFAEYTIFTAAVVLIGTLGTPSSFKFSTRALVMALEAVITGFCFGLVVLETVVDDPLNVLLKEQWAPHILAGVVGFLGFILVARVLIRALTLTKEYSLFFALAHLLIVVGIIYQVGQLPFNNFMTGAKQTLPASAITKCGGGFVALLALQVLRSAYATNTLPASGNLKGKKTTQPSSAPKPAASVTKKKKK